MSDEFYIIIMVIIFIVVIFGEGIVGIFTQNKKSEEQVMLEKKKTLKITEELKRHIGINVKIKFKDNFDIIPVTYGQNNPVKIIGVDNVWVEAEFTYKKKIKKIIFKISDIDNIEISR